MDAVATYREAVAHHPTWVRGVRRAAEIVLMEKGVADDLSGGADADSDALAVLDKLIDLVLSENSFFSRTCSTSAGGNPVRCQHFNLQWILLTASSLHAERGNLARSVFIAGLHCSVGGCNPAGDGPLNAAEILPHYNIPLPPIPDGESSDEDGATVAVFDAALSDDVFASVQHGFRSGSSYWGRGGAEYTGDFYSHWYDLKTAPINSVQQAIQQLAMRIPPSERKLIRGVEWWAHKRPFGDANAHPRSVEGRRYTRS